MKDIRLIPIDIDSSLNGKFRCTQECIDVVDVYPGYYERVGYNPPWIGYFATVDGSEMLGCGGFKGQPRNGKVEIAYGTFKAYEGKGVGKTICRLLVDLSLRTDPSILITARTLSDNNASASILKRNGFVYTGIVFDDDDGEVAEWEYRGSKQGVTC